MSQLWNKMYPPEEVDRISKMEEQNNKFEDFFTKERTEWGNVLNSLFDVLFHGNFTMNNSKKIIDSQAEILRLRQKCNDDVGKYSQRLSKAKSQNVLVSQQKFLFYSTGFGLKTNLGEKKLLIDGHLRENERYSQIIETHVEYLRETLRTLDNWGYSIKNIIQIIELLGK